MPAYVHEYLCGCLVHQLAGTIRKCPGMTSRSLSGKMVAKQDNSENRHNDAMNKEPVKVYEVAEILP